MKKLFYLILILCASQHCLSMDSNSLFPPARHVTLLVEDLPHAPHSANVPPKQQRYNQLHEHLLNPNATTYGTTNSLPPVTNLPTEKCHSKHKFRIAIAGMVIIFAAVVGISLYVHNTQPNPTSTPQ